MKIIYSTPGITGNKRQHDTAESQTGIHRGFQDDNSSYLNVRKSEKMSNLLNGIFASIFLKVTIKLINALKCQQALIILRKQLLLKTDLSEQPKHRSVFLLYKFLMQISESCHYSCNTQGERYVSFQLISVASVVLGTSENRLLLFIGCHDL